MLIYVRAYKILTTIEIQGKIKRKRFKSLDFMVVLMRSVRVHTFEWLDTKL